MREPKFIPKPGQTDYTNIRRAPVINCVVKHKDGILLVKRNSNMRLYPNYWTGISGFLDDSKSIKEKAKEELREEIGLKDENIISIAQGRIFEQKEPKYDKIWIVHPVLVEVNTDKIKLDWEAEDYKWIKPKEAGKFRLLPGFDKILRTFFEI